MQGCLACKSVSYRRSRSIAPEAGGPGFLGTGVHVTFVVVYDPSDVIVFAQGIIERTVADIVDSTVSGKYYDLGQNIIKTVCIGLVQAELGPQSRSRGGSKTVVARLINPRVKGINKFRDLITTGGVNVINRKSAINHMVYGPPVFIRKNLDPLVKCLNTFGAVTQAL